MKKIARCLHTRQLKISFLLATSIALSGCTAALVAGGAVALLGGASVVSDPRTVGTNIDDEGIELKATVAIAKDRETFKSSHINVVSYNQVVLLTGETPNSDLRDKAERIVADLPKVRRVHNRIQVRAPSSYLTRTSDTWLTSKVKTKLLATKEVPSNHIKVVSENGEVYLLGLVSEQEADTAINAAREVQGVQKVVYLFEYAE